MARDKYSDILEEMFGPAADVAETSNIPAGTQQGLKTSTAPADVWGAPSDKLQSEFGLSEKELKDNEQAFLSEIESSNRQPVFKLDFSENAVNNDRAREESFRKAFQDRIGAGALLSQEDVEPYKHTQTLSDGEELIEYRIGEESYPQQVVDQYIASYNDERLHEQRFKEDADYRNEWFLRNVGISERRYRENLANEMESRLAALKELIKPPKRQPATHTRGGYAAIGAAMNESRAQSGDGGGIASHKIDEALEKVRTLRKNNFWSGFGEGFDLGNIITMDLKNVADNVALLKALNKSSRGEQLTKSEQALVDAFEISNDAEEAIELLGGRTWLTNTGRGGAQSLGFVAQMIGTGGVASAATKGITRAAAKTALKRAVNNSAASSIERALQQGALKVAESAVGAAARVPFSGYTYRTYTDKRLNQFQVEERLNEATGEVERYIGKNETSALRDAVRSALESYFEMQSEDVGGWLDYGVKSFAKSLPRKNIIRQLATESLSGPVKNAIPKFIKRAGKIYSLGGEVLSEAYGDAMVNLLTGDDEGWRQMATKDYWWELGGVSAMLSGGFSAINWGVNRATGESKLRSQLERARKRALGRIENEALKAKLNEASEIDDLSERSRVLSNLGWDKTLTRNDMANATDFITAQTKLDVGDYSAAEADRLARMVPALEQLQVAAHDGEISDKELQEAISGSYARAFRVQENQQELARIADRIRMAAEAGVSADDINNIIARAGLTVYTPGDEVETLSGIRGMVNRVYPGAYELVDSQGNTGVFQFEEILQPAPEVQEAQLANEKANAEADMKNVLLVTLSEGGPAIVTDGHVSFNEFTGEIDKNASTPEVEVQQDGVSKRVSIDDIVSIYAPSNFAPVVQQAVTEASNQARAQAEAIKNMDDDVVYEATMTDGTAVHIIKGKTIVYNAENGELDYEASEPTVVVQYDNGDRRLVSIRDIDSIDEAISVVEVAEVAGQAMKSAVETMQQPAQESQQAVPPTIETAQQAGPPAAEQQAEQAPAAEIAEATKAPVGAEPNPMIGRSLSDEEAVAVISRMEKNATVAPELELTPENWDAQFGEEGIVETPIGDVKMGENQYLKLSRKGREGKLGMVKPTLENPDVIIEEKSSAGDAAPTERNSSFVFLKAFTNADGLRMYKFASVTIRKDGREVVISNQEKETPRIKRLLKEGMLTYISDATLPSESTASTQGAQPTIPGGATLSESKNTTSEPNNQEVSQKNVASPEIPTLKNGQPDYNAMSPEMFVEQYSAALGADKTELVARNNIKADNKAIADIEKKIAAITDPNKLPELDAKLEVVKAHKAHYVSVLEIMGLSEAVEDDSARQNRLRKDFAGRMAELFPGGFPNVESLILYDMATGVKFRWEDKETNGSVVSRGLGTELGLSAADAERKRRIGLLASDAPTPEEYAEQLRERLDAQGIRYDETELRDKVIDVLSSVDTVGSARKALEQLAASLTQEEEALDYEDEQARRAYERERQGLAKEDGSYKLSSEVDENGRQFVLSSSGNVEFGEISEESGLPPAPILLSEGMITNKATNDGYGLVHIEARHGDQIRKAGYKSVVDFIEDVAQNYEVIKEGNARDGNNTYLLQITDKHNNTLMVELSGDGTYWNINTAGIFKTSYGKNRKEVYNRHTTAKQPAETDEASRNAEPSGTQADPSMITTSTLNSSDNKNTTSVPNNQEVAQKKVDDPGLIGDEELSVEDETPFAIVDEAVPADSSAAAQLATEAAIMALEDAGIEVVEATSEMVEEALQKRDVQLQAVEQKFNEQLAGFSEENPSLVGLHNISEEKLRKALRMGGLVNPSVAVIDSNTQRHTDYGDITLVLPSSLVAQETGKNIGTYFGDAWTPTYPQVERRMRNDQASKDIASLPDQMRNTVRLALNSWLDGRAGDALAYMFLHERGEAPELHTVKAEYSQELRDAILAITGGKEFYYLTPEQRQQVLDLYIQKEHNGSREEFDAHLKRTISRSEKFIAERGANSLIGKKAQEVIDTINEYGYDYDAVSRFVRAILRDAETSGVVDAPYTALLADRKIKEDGLEQEYAKWVDSLIDRYAVEEVIFKGYTPSGNRKYVPNTLENASKEMREQGRAGATGFAVGFSRFAAQLLKSEGALDAIRKRKGQLKTSHEEVEAFKDKWSAVLFDLAEKCQPNATGYENYGFERLAEAATKKSPKTYLKKEYGVELSDEDAKRLDDMIKAIRTEYPVMYFETKFERPVYFNEFAGAIVPDDAGEDIIQSLRDNGLSVQIYPSKDENARMEAVKRIADTSNDIFFSIGPAPVFVSNAKIAVMGIKQEKATPEQWLKMIEKAGGLKAGEDKWIGLSDWLKDLDKKTISKQEVLDYINENQIQIEEARYSSDSAIEATPEFAALRDEYRSILRRYEDEARRNLEEFEERMAKKYGFSDLFDTTALNDAEERAHITLNRTVSDAYLGAWGEMWDKYGDDFDRAFMVDFGGLRVNKASDARRLLHLKDDAPIYHLREEYTTRGLNGNREIALTVPTIEPWNTSDEVHFGDAGGGRAIAWVRFGETTDSDGKRVLAIDEIQSKRHQEGREYGYTTDVTEEQVKKAREEADVAFRMLESFDEQMAQKYGTRFWSDQGTNEEYAHWELLRSEYDRYGRIYEELYDKRSKAIPAAPFEKNWAELAMKRMLRYAAENGYDKVAWTTGNQQAERYNLSKSIDYIEAQRHENGTYDLDVATVDDSHFVEERGISEARLSELVGKEVALSIVKETQENKDGKTTIEGDGLRIGGEGMRAFYDQMLPSFMRKYGKKWGATVGEVTLPYVEEAGRTMHAVDITDSMRESVMQGQPMFYRRPNGVVYGWTNGKTVYLTPEGMNPNTPIHEYTHIWADAMMKNNPKGWESIVKLLKGTPVWKEVVADANYANIKDNDNQVASETLSRLSGRNNAAKMEAMVQQLLDEGGNDSVKKNRARKLLDRMRKALQEFWSWVGKELFGIEKFESIDEVTDRVLYDLVSGTDLGAVPAEGIHIDQQLTADKSFIHAYDSAFDELSSEYDALDKTDEAALKAFRAKKLDLVERYMSSMSSNLAMPTTPVVVDASDPDSVKKAYELLPDEYRKFVTFDAFIDEVSSAVGFYVADSKMSVYNISKNDALNSSREWLGILAHENGHKAVETLGISDSDKEKLWEFCKRTTTSVRNKIERGYESAAEKGEEYLVYTIQSRARYPRLGDLLAECIMGEKTAQDVVKTFKDSLPLRDEIVEKILNYFRDGYRKARGEADYSAAAGRAKSKEEVQGFYNRFRGGYSQGLRRDNSVGRDLDEILFSIGEQPLAPAAEKVEPTEEEKKAAEAEKRLQSLNRLQRSVRALVKKLHQAKEDDSDIATLIAEALEAEVDKEGLQKFLDTGRFIQEITSSISKESIQASLNRMSDQIANAVIKHRKELLAKTMGIQVQTTTSMGIAIAHGVDDKTRAAIEVFRRFHKMQKPAPAYDSAGLTVGSKVLVSTKGDEAFSAFIDNNTEVNVLDKQDLMLWHTLWSDVADSEDAYITISLDIKRLSEKSKELYRKIKDAPKLSKFEETLKKERKLVLETRRAKERERLEVKQQIAQSLGDLLIAISQRIDIGRHARKGQLAADDEYRRDYLNRAMEDIRVGNVVTAYDKGVPKELIEKKKKDQSLWGFYKEHYYSFVYMVQSVSINAIAGKGFLYDTLIEGADGVMACQNREISYNNVDEGRILNKAQELGFKNLDGLANLFDRPLLANNGGQYILTHSNVYEMSNEDRKRPGRVAVEEVPMTIGYATYLVQMADQPGILPTITKGMKLSKDDISALRDMLDKDMNGGGVALKFMDFAVDMLSDLREQRYNGASLERYGTQLDNNENYFPVRRLEKNLRKDQVDLDEIKSDVASKVQASVTASALVKRVKSYTAIDIRQNPLRLMLDHVHEMNHFAATAPVVRNLQILLNSPAFKEQLNAQKNIAGNEKLNNYDRFELSAALAVGSFKPRTNTLNEVISSMQSLVAAGKVSWRFFTAAKQVLSLPAFVAYSTSWKYWGRLLRNISSLGFLPKKEGEKRCIHVVKWCMENIPTYRERWRERHAGDERIQSLSATRLAKWMYRTNFATRWIQKKLIEEGGMWANAAVDIFVCGIGARSVYEYEVERLQKKGMGKAEASELAKRRAAIAFNESQQSSLNAFLSPAQRLKDFVSLYTSIFENSNRSYGRKASLAYDYLRTELMDDKQRKGRYELEVKREVARLENQMRRDLKAENELEPDFSKRLSDEMIENRISATRPTLKQKAEAEAMMKVREARKRAIAEWVTYKFGLNFLWKISPMLATSLVMFDDDDEDKDGLNEYSAKKLLLSFVASYFRNGVGGATFESILDGYEFNTMLGQNIDMLWKNAERFIQGFREEEEEVDWQAFRLALNAVSNMSINVDLSTIGNVWKGVEGVIRDLSINTEDVLRLINAPKSMIAAAVIPTKEGESEHDYIRRMAYMNAISPEQVGKIEEAYSDSDYKSIFRDDLTSRDRAVKRKLDMWAKNYRAMKDAKILGVAYEKSLQGRITVPMLEELDDEYKKVLLATRRTVSGEKRPDRKQLAPLTSEAKARITSMGLPRRIRKIHKLEKRLKGYSEIANDYASTLQEVVKLKESVVTEWNQKP